MFVYLCEWVSAWVPILLCCYVATWRILCKIPLHVLADTDEEPWHPRGALSLTELLSR